MHPVCSTVIIKNDDNFNYLRGFPCPKIYYHLIRRTIIVFLGTTFAAKAASEKYNCHRIYLYRGLHALRSDDHLQ